MLGTNDSEQGVQKRRAKTSGTMKLKYKDEIVQRYSGKKHRGIPDRGLLSTKEQQEEECATTADTDPSVQDERLNGDRR